jgi:CelD/BcsL family acetyltransferase involved in cellulose biosynthesis
MNDGMVEDRSAERASGRERRASRRRGAPWPRWKRRNSAALAPSLPAQNPPIEETDVAFTPPCDVTGTGGAPREVPPIEVVVEAMADYDRLAAQWRELEARADASFFLSWYWIGTWLRMVDLPIYVVAAYAGERCVGLALLAHRVVTRHRVLKVSTFFLHKTGDRNEDVVTIEYNDVLAERGLEDAVRAAVLRALFERDRIGGRRCDALVWRGTVGDVTASLDALDLRWRHLDTTTSAYVDLARIRASGEPYLAHLRSNTRRQVRRARDLYEERGPLRLERAASVPQALAFFREAGELHRRRWHERGKPGAFDYPFYVGFHERLITTGVPDGVVELVHVRAGEDTIGYLYNFVYGGRVGFYLSGLCFEDDNRLKPGLVTHTQCIEDHVERGADVYDFMGGADRYKLNLGQPGPDMVGVAIEWPRAHLRVEAALRNAKRSLEARLERRRDA